MFAVTSGDPVKSETAKKIKRVKILNYNYRQRVSRLNDLLTGIEQLKQIEKSNN